MSFSSWYRGKGSNNDTPGPGAYKIPDVVGNDGPKYTCSSRYKERMAPYEPPIRSFSSTLESHAISFGARSKELPKDETPGPYFVDNPIGRDAPKISFKFKPKEIDPDGPGPAEYSVPRHSLPSTKIQIHSGKRTDFIDHATKPGPSEYMVPSQFKHHKRLSIGPSIPLPEPERNGPGPVYDMDVLYKLGKYAPKYSLPKDPKNHETYADIDEDKPAPADYVGLEPLLPHGKIAYSIQIRGRPPLSTGDLRDYPYNKIPDEWRWKDKRVAMHTRPETNYETLSPGPNCYKTIEPAIEDRPISIGHKTNYNLKVCGADSPGPAAYFKTLPTPKPLPFTNFAGGCGSRAPEEIKRDSWKPAPGQYEQKGDFEADRPVRGFQFGSRTMENYVPDTAAPYQPQFSTFNEGPRFTLKSRTD